MRCATEEISRRCIAAVDIATQAGELALTFFRSSALERESKGPQDFVSEADRATEGYILGEINARFPDDSCIGEELGGEGHHDGFIWIIDPIDGTTCFLDGIASWVISIAIVYNGQVVVGVIRDPSANETFSAVSGSGAYLNGSRLPKLSPAALNSVTIGVGYGQGSDIAGLTGFLGRLLHAGANFLRNGSAASMLAWVAAGRLGGYYQAFLRPWDCLAGLLLIKEVGGEIRSRPLGEMISEGGAVLAVAPGLGDPLMALQPPLPAARSAASDS